jgi:alpha-methylacyl-CoA racemase
VTPLDGISVLDFSTLLPGPLAGLILAEAGADVLKVERPGIGDEMRTYDPQFGHSSANFALLNRGKRSLAVDLKSAGALDQLREHIERADILIEQFRPGVMDRLGLGFASVNSINPRIIYCSITGWGQTGPMAGMAGHDLNYMAEVGLLDLVRDKEGSPGLPPVLAADIAGGTYPAIVNILLALRARDETGQGMHLDIAMADNLFTFGYWALAGHGADGRLPRPGGELVTGGTPRYAIYRTNDGGFIAAAPLEDRFWSELCELVDMPEPLRESDAEPMQVREILASRFLARSSDEWRALFAGRDICCNVVATLADALRNAQFHERKLFDREVVSGDRRMPALPVPVIPQLRNPHLSHTAPDLTTEISE